MSVNDDNVTASSDSFWEVGKYNRTVQRIDNGYKLCASLRQLIDQRSEIERNYAKQLTQWSKKWNDFLDKGPEYGTTQGAWRGVLTEAEKVADLHVGVADKLMSNVYTSIKTWQKENYHKSMMHFKETKEMDDAFKKVQKPWEKKLNKVLAARKEYHAACRSEKSTANQENNARGDSSFSPDQLKKLQEKLKKFQAEVDSSRDKYQASLNDLNGYNAKYMEDMSEVFEKCQDFEKRRIEFVKKIMFDIHQCLDLSVEPRYSQVYTDLHQTISNTDAGRDLKWWSTNHGADMAMNWPVFEEYSPELQAISKKEKKSSQISSGDGITITSIKRQQDDNFSFQQQSSQPASLSRPTSQESGNLQQSSTPRQESYDESLNPFGEDDIDTDGENIANAKLENPSQNPPATMNSNPFGTDDTWDAEDDRPPTPPPDDTTPPGYWKQHEPVLVKALYAYDPDPEADDEIGFGQGDEFFKLSDEDDMGWCKGRKKDGVEGVFPASYVEICGK